MLSVAEGATKLQGGERFCLNELSHMGALGAVSDEGKSERRF